MSVTEGVEEREESGGRGEGRGRGNEGCRGRELLRRRFRVLVQHHTALACTPWTRTQLVPVMASNKIRRLFVCGICIELSARSSMMVTSILPVIRCLRNVGP